jgi:putative flippase GtrA
MTLINNPLETSKNPDSFQKTDSMRIISYVCIGICTTLATFLLWNVLIFLTQNINLNWIWQIDFKQKVSLTYLIASVSMIYPSFYLNRRITFSDKKIKDNSKIKTFSKVYLVYLCSPLVAAIISYFLQNLYNFENLTISSQNINNFFGTSIDNFSKIGFLDITEIRVGRYFLQGITLFCGMCINYFGQKKWVYR